MIVHIRPPSKDHGQGSVPTLLAGAASGAVAAAVMGIVFAASEKAGAGEDPPQRIANETVRRATGDERVAASVDEPLGSILHIGFGAALGAIFAVIAPAIERPVRDRGGVPAGALTTGTALAFASLVYLVSYAGWVPALGILRPPDRDRPGRQIATAIGHLVFGATLAAVLDRTGHGPRDRA